MGEDEQMGRWGGEQVKSGGSRKYVKSQRDLEVWQRAFAASMEIFRHSKLFPPEEKYSLTDQIRRSSRSVSTNITEAWRKRRYAGSFVVKLNDAETDAAETQDWLYYAVECGYLERSVARPLFKQYEAIIRTLVGMITHSDTWVFPDPPSSLNHRASQN